MVEFGEKVKKLREEKGMTQQTLAEMLYVTRQAVSRWECGARYLDLLMAKKIAQILNVTVDELLSGEELKKNIEKEPVLGKPAENVLQTALYTMAVIAYLLMCIFSLYSVLRPNEALAGTPAGEITIVNICTMVGYVINATVAGRGLLLSMRNRLGAKVIGCIMCMPYIVSAGAFLITYIDMQIKDNGIMNVRGWLEGFAVPLFFAVIILIYFIRKERRMSWGILLLICVITLFEIGYGYRHRLRYSTDLGFVVTTVHCLGKIGMVCLLGYQAYIFDKKKKMAYKEM